MPVTVWVHKAPEPPGIGPWVGLSFTCLAHLELGLRQSGRGDLHTTSTSPHRQFVNHSTLLVGSFNVCSCYLRIYWPCFPCAAATWKSARLHCSDLWKSLSLICLIQNKWLWNKNKSWLFMYFVLEAASGSLLCCNTQTLMFDHLWWWQIHKPVCFIPSLSWVTCVILIGKLLIGTQILPRCSN